jgi:anti-sigma regulatory factor (Ser/Thr protein kinase)
MAPLELHSDLREGDLQRLFGELEQCPKERPIDLSGIRSVDPATLALLVASLKDVLRGSRDPDRITPSVVDQTCLGPSGIAALQVAEGEEWQADEGERLLGWKAFAGDPGLQAAVCGIASTIAKRTPWTHDSCTTFTALALEIMENVGQHSGRSEGVLALGVDPKKELIRMAITDRGMGIRSSLLQNPECAGVDDDLLAIEMAMEAGGTGEPGSGGGMGLYFARALLRGNGGRIVVHSGSASLEEDDERSARRHPAAMTGTLVLLEAHGNRPLAADEVRHRLAALRSSD